MKNNMRYLLKRIFFVLCWCAAGAAACIASSIVAAVTACSAQGEPLVWISGDFTIPQLLRCTMTGAQTILMDFSKPVTVSASLYLPDANTAIRTTAQQKQTDETENQAYSILLTADEPTETGSQYLIQGEATDEHGNSLSFSVPVTGYNENVPILVLSEIRTKYTKGKSEFVELYAVTGGNLAGVTFFSAYDGTADSYQFPSTEVQSGEYIVLHMRSLEDGCIDETSDDLNAATASEAVSDVRDFWISNTTARIGDSDILILYNDFTGEILDCVLFSASEKTTWKNEAMQQAAQLTTNSGVWQGTETADAVCSDGITPTRTLSRQNIPDIQQNRHYDPALMNGKEFWMITATSTASPGAPNSDKPYIQTKKTE